MLLNCQGLDGQALLRDKCNCLFPPVGVEEGHRHFRFMLTSRLFLKHRKKSAFLTRTYHDCIIK